MFFKRKKLRTDMIDTSSRMALKMTCLNACSGNVSRAQELYAFLADGITDIPDYTPPRPTITQHMRNAFTWIKDNREDIASAWQFVQQMRSQQATTPVPTHDAIPPLPNISDNASTKS
jgi:hypothetical protein